MDKRQDLAQQGFEDTPKVKNVRLLRPPTH